MAAEMRTIVVLGATGLQGGAVARHLLSGGWHVRAVTRNAQSVQAQALSALGAQVVQGDMGTPATLVPIFEGAYGLFSVQNPMLSGIGGEIKQGKHVADVAKQAGVQHLVYSSAGPDIRNTGVPSWESKVVIEDYMNALGLPLTVLRPMAFMELMTAPKFFPAVSTWHVMPNVVGNSRKVGWLCANDLGIIAAKAFAAPEQFLGQAFSLVSDVQSIDECRTLYREVMGKNPSRFPMPVWMFARLGFVGHDLGIMWRWLRDTTFEIDPITTFAIHPQALRVRDWLEKVRGTNEPSS